MIGRVSVPEFAIHKALFELSQSIAGHGDLESLCAGLVRSLHQVVSFDFLGLVLQDSTTGLFHLHTLTELVPPFVGHVELPANTGNALSWVWEHQEPLILSPVETETRWTELVPILLEKNVHSLAVVPLTNGDHRIGILGFGSFSTLYPDPDTIAFLQRVTSEFSVAVESYLTRQELLLERDRLQVLFDITNVLVSTLSWEDLLEAISDQLQRVVDHDVAALTVLDKETGELHLRGLRVSGEVHWNSEIQSGRPEGMPAGEALRTGEPVVVNEIDFDRFPSPLYRKAIEAGFHMGCSIPLLTRNGVCGTLELGRRSGKPFTGAQVKLLVQAGRQVAIALENSLAYNELAAIKEKLATEKLYLEDEIRSDQNFERMVGESPAFQSVMNSVRIVAPTDATVLLSGETGTGKELVARALHDSSGRSKQSFIKVNCAAIPANLLESELFGHEKGSFTGAIAQKMGRFELAHHGTLFLDEVGEIPLELQSKLLRVIQEQEFERLGGNRTIRVDVRFIAATNRDLKQMVDEGKFRSDLYYRLHVFPLVVPPLRERREDIPLLVRFFVQKYAQRLKRPIDKIPSSAMAALTAYDWPGNIRELQNVIERSVILTPGDELRVSSPELAHGAASLSLSVSQLSATADRARIVQALKESHGRISGPDGAAARLGLKRTTLQSRMKKLNIGREYR
jgi:formate hydrogenlyase transcriptional activator